MQLRCSSGAGVNQEMRGERSMMQSPKSAAMGTKLTCWGLKPTCISLLQFCSERTTRCTHLAQQQLHLCLHLMKALLPKAAAAVVHLAHSHNNAFDAQRVRCKKLHAGAACR